MNGHGIFFWKDGRSYKGEYKDDKKHSFGIYYGNGEKRYDGFWEEGVQKNLGKYTKKDGSFKIGYWDDNQLIRPILSEKEMSVKLAEIDSNIEDTNKKISFVLYNMKALFVNYLPNIEFESLLAF